MGLYYSIYFVWSFPWALILLMFRLTDRPTHSPTFNMSTECWHSGDKVSTDTDFLGVSLETLGRVVIRSWDPGTGTRILWTQYPPLLLRYWKGQTKEILGVPAYLESYTLLFLQLMKPLPRDFFVFWCLPSFDQPCLLKAGVPPWALHLILGSVLVYQSTRVETKDQ